VQRQPAEVMHMPSERPEQSMGVLGRHWQRIVAKVLFSVSRPLQQLKWRSKGLEGEDCIRAR
jgi:hypothetical protein